MTFRTVWLHLRVPFSFFLLPVFLFALSQSDALRLGTLDWIRVAVVWVVIHLLLYPASNAYNSYFDKDEGSIGILETPPPVDKTLFYVAWALDLLALLLGIWVGWPFVAYLLIYGFISKAYSHPAIRLKKYPVMSWLIVSLFQGGFTYLMTLQAIDRLPIAELMKPQPLLAALLCTMNLLAVYPITQIYQHEEDSRRGDLTMSRLLGVRGTFLNAVFWFAVSLVGFYQYFRGAALFWLLPVCLLPGVVYFLLWYWRVNRDVRQADFRSAMTMTLLSGTGLNFFFLFLLILTGS
ncbi:1,4-dihydroxy-2-naphthoate octaprenyltransferase [Larkinella arboricola]|uniref:1,4-dihydroxy-2-naphthoate octaprenyltransferase n=1 Tax=Larkinella arboricola TaxID=643671 RepID=A0A327WYE6_LARAB|nr:UbiA family prenyltransferase [Larkinella arboricola]RAJ97475.1 1,4-dihydroxy-2-naphthoate octaprenyltransferase [Larkinella arboricola]